MVLNYFYVLILAILIALFFNYGLNIKGPWGTLWTFFVIVFLTALIAQIWLKPFGPYWGEIYWFPGLTAGLIIALVLAAATPVKPKNRNKVLLDEKVEADNANINNTIALGYFFLGYFGCIDNNCFNWVIKTLVLLPVMKLIPLVIQWSLEES
ncbi:MAG: hypothetical protein HC905_18535 [Bacteroidales bacterium]|nr:hypothetical protein [Bacteroidales bacterium]